MLLVCVYKATSLGLMWFEQVPSVQISDWMWDEVDDEIIYVGF